MKQSTADLMKSLRKEYVTSGLKKSTVSDDPMAQFSSWFSDAVAYPCYQPNGIALATADASGLPSLRMVLLKEFSEDGFIFFTNYESRKGRELSENPNAAMLLYWQELHRQVRIEGPVKKLSRAASEAYFQTRPHLSQISAHTSQQSRVIENRRVLEKMFQELINRYPENAVPAPDYWGGFCLEPVRMEFWQGQENRLHDRILYQKTTMGWQKERLSP